jgi:hypothetical protein
MLPPHRPFKDRPVRKPKALKPKRSTHALPDVGVDPLALGLGRSLSPKRMIVAPEPGSGRAALLSVRSKALVD